MTGELISANALLAANALLLGAAAIELLRVRRLVRRWRERPRPAEAATPADDGERLVASLDERLAALRRIADELAHRQQALQPPSRPPVLEDAARLARTGADAAELSRACGLNRGAAELVLRLHAGRK